jgi:hypothetical protein
VLGSFVSLAGWAARRGLRRHGDRARDRLAHAASPRPASARVGLSLGLLAATAIAALVLPPPGSAEPSPRAPTSAIWESPRALAAGDPRRPDPRRGCSC